MAKLGEKATVRIFVDANTIVSGILFEGNEARLLELGLAHLSDIVTTEYVVEEVKRVLRREEFGLSADQQSFLISYLYRCARVYPSPTAAQLAERADRLKDQKDIPVLASYEVLQCDALVTGDAELLKKVPGARRAGEMLRILLHAKA